MELVRTDMDHFTIEFLLDLTEISTAPCLSLYMPTHRRGPETEQDPIRFKNLLAELETQLLAADVGSNEVSDLLEPLQILLDDAYFWQHQSNGLAIFRTADRFITYRLPLSVEPLTVASQRPHIKPLLPLVTTNGHFCLLALSQNQVRFFQGTRFQLGEIQLEETPGSLAEAMRFDEYENQLQFHTETGSSRNGERAAIFHGHSDAGDEAVITENIKRFLHRVDEGVCNYVEDQRTPLVLAGVDSIRGQMNAVANYATIVDEGIEGNPEMWDEKELHRRAWLLVEPRFKRAQLEERDRYLHLAGTGDPRASSDLSKIVSGAYFQHVETLFIPNDAHQWGTFDPDQNQVQLHPKQQPGDHDLFDFAALHTLRNGGAVYVVGQDGIPSGHDMAAILRYG